MPRKYNIPQAKIRLFYLLNRRSHEPHRQPGHFEKEKNLPLPGIKPWIIQPIA
jgi:hypothetical protein